MKKSNNKHKKISKKLLKIKDLSKVLGRCYLCNRDITKDILASGRGLHIGKGKYRCRGKKCEKKVLTYTLKQLKTRKVWGINPVTKVIPNKKKKNRAKINRELRKELEF